LFVQVNHLVNFLQMRIRKVSLCFSPVVKHAYVTWGSIRAISESTSSCSLQTFSTFSETYSAWYEPNRDDVFLPLLVGSWCLKMFVLLHQVLWLYYMIQHFVSSGKQPNSGPKRLRSNHQLFKFKIVPPAEKSSVISSPWVVPSFDDISNPPITKRRAGEV